MNELNRVKFAKKILFAFFFFSLKVLGFADNEKNIEYQQPYFYAVFQS